MAKTLTTTEFAAELETDARTARKFLRSITPKEGQPGKGSRWVIPGNARDITKFKKQFEEWAAAREAEKAEADETPADSTAEDLELDD